MSWRDEILSDVVVESHAEPTAEPVETSLDKERAFGQPPSPEPAVPEFGQPPPALAQPRREASPPRPAVEEAGTEAGTEAAPSWREAAGVGQELSLREAAEEGQALGGPPIGAPIEGWQGPGGGDSGWREAAGVKRSYDAGPGWSQLAAEDDGFGRPPDEILPVRRLPLMGGAPPGNAGESLARFIREQEGLGAADGPGPQDSFSRHLLSSFGFGEAEAAAAKLNAAHPAFNRELSKNDYQVDGPESWPVIYDVLFAVKVFDESYEQAIWDYDPKFIWDYLPLTKRGTQKLPPGIRFLKGVDYTKDENAWQRYAGASERKWREDYVPKVQYVQRCKEMGVQPPPNLLGDKKKTNNPEDAPTNIIFKYFVENIGWKEELISPEYCGVCDQQFTSVLPSMNHYSHERHDKAIRSWFIDSLWDHGKVSDEEVDQVWFANTVNRLVKKYKTKPQTWDCAMCGVTLTSVDHARTHFKGVQHQRRAKGLPVVEKVPKDFYKAFENHCAACNVDFRDRQEARRHTESKFHMMNVDACARNNITLPPGPSSMVGQSNIARKIWKKVSSGPVNGTGGNLQPLATKTSRRIAVANPDSAGKARLTQMGFFPAGEHAVAALTCTTCNKVFPAEAPYLLHMASQQHLGREMQAARKALKGAPVKSLAGQVSAPKPLPARAYLHSDQGPGNQVDEAKIKLLREQAIRRSKMVRLSIHGNPEKPINPEKAKGARAVDPAAYLNSGATPYGVPRYEAFGAGEPHAKYKKSVNRKVAESIAEQARQATWVPAGQVLSSVPGGAGFVGAWTQQ